MAPLSDELDPDSTIGRTSTPELRARDLTSNRSTCSGKQRHPLCRPPRGSQPAARTMDARDKQALGKRSRGRSRASFYNPRRRHSSIGYLSPIDYERRHQDAAVNPNAHKPATVHAAVKDKPFGRPQEGAVLDRRCARQPHHRGGRDGRMAPPGAEPKNVLRQEGNMPSDQLA